jgi:hypothetical protein
LLLTACESQHLPVPPVAAGAAELDDQDLAVLETVVQSLAAGTAAPLLVLDRTLMVCDESSAVQTPPLPDCLSGRAFHEVYRQANSFGSEHGWTFTARNARSYRIRATTFGERIEIVPGDISDRELYALVYRHSPSISRAVLLSAPIYPRPGVATVAYLYYLEVSPGAVTLVRDGGLWRVVTPASGSGWDPP